MSRSRKAFALSIVLWIVAILLLGIAFIASLSKESLKITSMLDDKLYTQIKAKNYLEAIKYHVLTSELNGERFINKKPILSLPSEMKLDGSVYKIGDVSISLRDLSGLIRPYYLYNTVDTTTYRELSFIIKDSIADWLDTDDNARLNGAEATYYTIQKQLGYRPSNIGMFQSLDELKLVKGVRDIDKKMWNYNLQDKVTYKPGSINLLLVDAIYLKAIFHISLDEAKGLIKLRDLDIKKFISILEQNKYFDDTAMRFFGISNVVNVKIIVQKNRAVTKLYLTLYFSHKDKQKIFYIDGYKIY